MKELALKYGCNPNQKPSRIYMNEGELPVEVLNGKPGYINFLDAFNSWQLVRELKAATGLPSAASFKHVSPAGAAVATELSDTLKKIYFVDDLELSPIASAYAAARGADRMSSYGDWVALSDTCDVQTAKLLQREVSDGIIAPDYTEEALEVLKTKRRGTYNIVKIDPNYVPAPIEHKDVFGVTFEQGRNELKIDEAMLMQNIVTENKELTEEAKRDLLIALITLKYTQSNSVCYAKGGQAIGVGAGQQSRIHCTRLAGNKADIWFLRQHPRFLTSRLLTISADLTEITLLMFTFLTIMRMYLQTAFGSSSLKLSRSLLHEKRRKSGSQHSAAFHSVQTHFSHSATTLKELSVRAYSMLHSPAVQSEMTM